MNDLDIVRRRLVAQRLASAPLESPEAVVAAFGAMQAQEYAEAKWSIAERSADTTDAELDDAFDRGAILRTHVMRPTWHFVTPADIRWLLALTAPRVHAVNRHWYGQSGLDEITFGRSMEILAAALADGTPRSRSELADELGRAGIEEPSGMRLGYILMHAELEALVCSGPRRGRQQTYALLDHRAPPALERPREASLADLLTRFFTTHGPATIRDFTWWSGLTVADAKLGLTAVGDALETRLDEDGRAWFHAATPLPEPFEERPPDGAFLLPTYDEAIVAYKDLRVVLAAPAPREGLLTRAIVIDGHTVGGWKRTLRSRSATIEATLFAPLSTKQELRLAAAVDRFGRFVGRPVTLDCRAA